MRIWKKNRAGGPSLAPVQCANPHMDGYASAFSAWGAEGSRRLYRALRQAVPIIDASLSKLARLIGEFTIRCNSPQVEERLNQFLQQVPVNGCQYGIQNFISGYLDQLLTYGTAVGEIVLTGDGSSIGALYNADLDEVGFRQGASPLDLQICRRQASGDLVPVPYPELIVTAALNPPSGNYQGVSILSGLPFVSDILLKIYHTIGVNWERVGNVRFAVTYKPSGGEAEQVYARERAEQIAREWGRAMQAGGPVSDFVAVGDVNIRVIGADNQILDSNVPVRQMLEQIVAKLGIPPFLLGLSWSSTERMSSQQADILTSELESYRRLLNPAIQRVCQVWLLLHGLPPDCTVCWDNITLQDEVDLADARLKNAQAAQIEAQIGKEELSHG